MKWTIEQVTPTHYFLSFKETNNLGEELTADLTFCDSSLPKLWKENGHIDRALKNCWLLSTFVYDIHDDCWGKYNPQHEIHTRYEKGKLVECRPVLNFDWVFEATYENAVKLLNEVERRFKEGK